MSSPVLRDHYCIINCHISVSYIGSQSLITLMKQIAFICLLWILAAQIPNCHVREDKQTEKLFLIPDESQVRNLADIFEGYNLRFTSNGNDTNSMLIPPFYQTDNQPNTGAPNITLLDLDVQTDGNLAWMNRACSLSYNVITGNYILSYGTLNNKLNVVMESNMTLNTTQGTICFNSLVLPNSKIVVDCQIVGQATDVLYVVDLQTMMVTNFTYQNAPLTSKRKSVELRLTGQRTYILSAFIGSGMIESATENLTVVSIYYLDNEGVTQKVGIINNDTVNLKDLRISDISVDALGNIYLTDERGTLFELGFDGANVTLKGTWPFEENIYKVSVHVTSDLVYLVQVVGKTQIFEVDLGDKQFKVSYQLPEDVTDVIDFDTNNQILVLQTTNAYYIYKRYVNLLSNMLQSFKDSNSRFVINPTSPNIIFLSTESSVSVLISQGFFVAKNPSPGFDAATTVNIEATSESIDGSTSVKCNAEFLMTTVDDTQLIYIKREPKQFASSESSALEIIQLDDYIVGSKLSYKPQSSRGVIMNLQHIDNITISSDDSITNADWFATYNSDLDSYFKVTVGNGNLVIQNCKYTDQGIQCKITRKMPFAEKILLHAFFSTTMDLKSNIPIMAYVTEASPSDVSLIQINSDKSFNALTVSPDFSITDIDANERFIFVTIRDAKQIQVFRNDLSNYTLVNIINPSVILDRSFYPKQTILSPVDMNLMVVVNVDSILIFKISAYDVQYIASFIPCQIAKSSISLEVVVGRTSMVIFVSDKGEPDQILEYSIYDPYMPLFLRSLSLFGKSLARPVTAYTVDEANLVAVRTQMAGKDYLSILRTAQPAVGSLLTDVLMDPSLLLSLVSTGDSAILEATQKIATLPKFTMITKRYYYHPLLLVKATIDEDNFKQVFTYNLSVFGISTSYNFNNSLQLTNIKSKITPSAQPTPKITFPKNSNAAEIKVEIDADSFFNGPVAKYAIECPYCGDKIRLEDHVIEVESKDTIMNVRDVYWFGDKSRLWLLNDTGVYITDNNMSILSSLVFPFASQVITAKKWSPIMNGNIVILINNVTNAQNSFVVASVNPNKETATILPPILISKSPIIFNPLVVKTLGNRIFVLDNTMDGKGQGLVYVFTINNSTSGDISFSYQYLISSKTLGSLTNELINDFQLVDLGNNMGFIVATLNNSGIGYGVFDSSTITPSDISNSAILNLKDRDDIYKYQINGSQFMQIELYSVSVSNSSILLDTLITVSNGQHLKMNINFKKGQAGFAFDNLNITMVFAKYGKMSVINWAQVIPYQDHADNLFLIAHEGNQKNNQVSIGLFNLDQEADNLKQMSGAIERNKTAPVMQNFVGMMFRDQQGLKAIVSVWNEAGGAKIYKLNKTVSIVYKFEQPGDFKTIKLIAMNQYNEASRDIEVDFQRSPEKGGLAWYIILIIVLGSLLVVGLITFFAIRHKRNSAANKNSLLSNSKGDSDEDI